MFKIGLVTRIFLSAGALFGGLLIVFISLTAANPVLSAEINESEKQFYFGQAILPDHVLYPVLMVADRAKLETVHNEEEIYTRVVYAVRRQEAAQQLLAKDKEALAYTTLTKAQKYLLHAGNQVISEKRSVDIAEYVEKSLIAQNQFLSTVKPRFSSQYFSQLDQIVIENTVIINQLEAYRK